MTAGIVFAAAVCLAGQGQQPATSPQPPQAESKPVPVTAYKPPSPHKSDQVQACPASYEFHPDVDGIYKIGDGVRPPVLTNNVNPEMTEQARRYAKQHGGQFHAVSLIGLVVDPEGMPQEICVKKAAGLGLDEAAVKSVKKYRFRPATSNGVPVAVRLTVEVNFRTY